MAITNMSMTHRVTVDEVNSAETLAEYCQQELGTPYPSAKNMIRLRTVLKTFFARNPRASYSTLCRVVAWSKANRRRPADVYMVPEMTRYAFQAGALPELVPHDEVDDELEVEMDRAAAMETDPDWRLRLTGSTGSARREVLAAWKRTRLSSLSR